MKRITMDEKGNVATLDDRNKQIMTDLRPVLDIQLKKKEQNMYLKKPQQLKFGAVINNKLLELFRNYDLMPEDDVIEIDAEDIKDYYLHFLSLVNEISIDIEITPTKPLFCAYMGITTKIFNKLAKDGNDEIRRWIDAINGDFTHSMLDSSLHGNASEKTALAFASTKDYGQETVQNDFNATITTKQEVDYTPQQAIAFTEKMKLLIAEKCKDKRK